MNTKKLFSCFFRLSAKGVGIGLSLAFCSHVFAQCGSAVMQHETGSAQRSKGGVSCLSGDPCPTSPPQYFLKEKTVRDWSNSGPIWGCCSNADSYTSTYHYEETDTYTLPNNDPTNDSCPITTSMSASISGSYTYDFTSACSDDDPSYNYSAGYNTSSNAWVDSNGNEIQDPWSTSYYGDCYGIGCLDGWGVTSLSCDSETTTMTNHNNGTGTVTITLSSPYATSDLESTVDGLAKGRQPTTFSDGDAASVNTIDSEEFCATAKRSKWRIKITGTTPNKSYDITYVKVVQHATGAPTRTTVKITKKAPNQDPWYVNSDSGEDVPTPSWASGCPSAGGTESISYTSAAITLSSSN